MNIGLNSLVFRNDIFEVRTLIHNFWYSDEYLIQVHGNRATTLFKSLFQSFSLKIIPPFFTRMNTNGFDSEKKRLNIATTKSICLMLQHSNAESETQ